MLLSSRGLIVSLLCVAAALAGCGSDDCETCSSGSEATSTGPACASTTGILKGAVTLFEPPDGPNSLASPRALLDLRLDPKDDPLHAKADDHGSYSVELPAGSWIVGGTSEDGYCKTFDPKTAEVVACGSTSLNVVLEACVN